MADREKVITHLDDMRLFADTRVHQIVSPENWEIYSELCNFIDLVKEEILDLLKEQEAKKGTWQWKIHGKPESGGMLGEAICDQCGKSTYATAVKGDLNYCPNCGANMMKRR